MKIHYFSPFRLGKFIIIIIIIKLIIINIRNVDYNSDKYTNYTCIPGSYKYKYDARCRGWYINTKNNGNKIFLTEPYLFFVE